MSSPKQTKSKGRQTPPARATVSLRPEDADLDIPFKLATGIFFALALVYFAPGVHARQGNIRHGLSRRRLPVHRIPLEPDQVGSHSKVGSVRVRGCPAPCESGKYLLPVAPAADVPAARLSSLSCTDPHAIRDRWNGDVCAGSRARCQVVDRVRRRTRVHVHWHHDVRRIQWTRRAHYCGDVFAACVFLSAPRHAHRSHRTICRTCCDARILASVLSDPEQLLPADRRRRVDSLLCVGIP